MSIASIPAAPDARPAAPVGGPKGAAGSDRLEEGLEAFESILTGTMVREMLQPGREGGLLGKGPGLSVLGGMVERLLAEQWAEAGGLGLRESLRTRLVGGES